MSSVMTRCRAEIRILYTYYTLVLFFSFPHVSVESLDKLELEFHDALGHLGLDSVLTGVGNMLAGFTLSVVNVTTGHAVQSVNIPSSNNM